MRVDLHVHTHVSDSSLSTEDTIKLAKSKGLTHVAITNHDTVVGLKEAMDLGAKHGVTIIPGIEISAYDAELDKRVHILGYDFNLEAPHIQAICNPLNNRRDSNTKWQVEQLIAQGYPITMEEVSEVAKNSTAFYKQHLFDVLAQKGITRQDVKHLFKNGGPCDRSIEYIDAVMAVKAIKADGGFAVIAHPGQSKNYEIIPKLVQVGLDGIEKYHPDHSECDYQKVEALCEAYELFRTAGSDFHAEYGPIRPFGNMVLNYLPFPKK
ncbi:MAG TPA: phosphatase [Firmicutes bacterium]|nr:phosphatase [Bacillota bacterium]